VLQVVIPDDDNGEPPMNDRKAFYADEEDQHDIDVHIASRNIPNPAKSKTLVAAKHDGLNDIEVEKHDNFFSINN